MPSYTNYANLYLPNKNDEIDVSTSLADNFQKIDDALEGIGAGAGGGGGTGATFINVKQYGALGNGVADDTAGIQAAINACNTAGGGIVYVPVGVYPLSATIEMKSNVFLTGEGIASRFIFPLGSSAFTFDGTFGTEINFASSVTLGGNSFTTTTAHGLAYGDLVLIKSQRNALSSADSGVDWCLGYGTPSVPNAYFAEFKNVQTVTSTTAFTTDSGTIYPNYSNNQTSDPNGRARATVFKLNPVRNARIEKISIQSSGTAFRMNRAYQCVVSDCDVTMVSNGSGGHMNQSFSCEINNVRIVYTSASAPPQIYSRNCMKITGSQECGFVGCKVDKGSQSADISFFNDDIISTHCYFRDNIITNATKTGITTHGGNFGTVITGNVVTNCLDSGIVVRGRQSLIANNRVQGTLGGTTSEGIVLYEGWARDCIIANNSISGFGDAIGTRDGADAGERFEYVGCTITGNSVSEYTVGVNLTRSTAGKQNGASGILISNNTFRNPKGAGAAIIVENYVNQYTIIGNHMYLDNTQSKGIDIQLDGGGGFIRNNVIYNSSSQGIVHAGYSDAIYTSAPELFLTDNMPIGFTTMYNVSTTIRVNRRAEASVAACEYYFTTAGSPKFLTNTGVVRNITFT